MSPRLGWFSGTSIALKRSADRRRHVVWPFAEAISAPRPGGSWLLKKLRIVLIGAVLGAAGCGRTPFPVLETQLGGLKGQPAQAVIKKLGAPTETSEIAGGKVYIWKSTDALGAGDAIGLQCSVQVFVDKGDKIARYDFSGNVAGCAHYAHRLDESYDLLRSTTPMPPASAPPAATPPPA
jgi:hypothetical protein